jgi:hypothetical protein
MRAGRKTDIAGWGVFLAPFLASILALAMVLVARCAAPPG